MYSNQAARMSVDSLSSPTSSPTSRGEIPFHRQGSVTSHPIARRDSNASSIHSIGGHLDTSISWAQGVHETSQNAISTLLQPPIVRTGLLPHTSAPTSSAHKPPTARDIPPVTLTNIPHIDASEFKSYLSQVGALYEQLRRVKESDEDSADQVFRRTSKSEPFPDFDDGHLRPGSSSSRLSVGRKASTTSLTTMTPVESPSIRRRSSSGLSRRAVPQGPPPLNTIPKVYFDEDFHLENPRTFDVVSERSEVLRPTPGSAEEKNAANGNVTAPRKALATNAILQEKLSWYMDTIEMHLISSISTASTTFFTALGSLRELHSEAADSVERIKTLRTELEALDQEIASSGLDIVEKRRRRENMQQLSNSVQQLREIVEGVATCENYVDEGELDKALNSIGALENLIAGRRCIVGSSRLADTQLRDLRDAVALQGVNSDIFTLRLRVGKAYESKFINILLGDLRRHVDTVSSQEVLQRWSSASNRARGRHSRESSAFPAYLTATEDLRSELMPVVSGLHQAKHIQPAIASYREIVLREVRNLIRRPLPSSNDEDNDTVTSASTISNTKLTQQEKSSILARNLRTLDHEDAEALFTKIYISVAETLRRLTTHVKVLFDVASSMGETPDLDAGVRSSPAIKSPALNSANREIQEDIHLTMDMANLLGQAVDVSHDKIVKVLRVRSEQSSHLPLDWFLRYFILNLYFANECESISGRSGTALKTIVNSHIKDFIQIHGDQEKQKLAQGMESDQWSAKDFAEKDIVLLDRVLECSTKDAVAWAEGSRIWIPYTDEELVAPNGRPRSESNGARTKEKARSAVVDGESYILPQSAILCLEGMSRFLHLISGIPSMAPDVATSLIAYLQLFNSRCTQLILGAGATRSAGLKNITTRHLALAAQALAFISALIPHVREFVRRHAGSGPNVNNSSVASLMGEFDKVKRLYQEHQNSIYDKLVEIMSGRATAHTRSIKALDWDRKADKDGELGVDTFMETLVHETVVLHRVLTKHLPEPTIRLIMGPVFISYKSQFGKTLRELEVKGEIAIKRMIADINYLNDRLSKIDGFGGTGEHLLSIVNAKKIESPPAVPKKGGVESKANGDDAKDDDEPDNKNGDAK